ncbi:hypothetical protein HHI36_000764 [Cryptolaemus montrouzieri]|uniref:RAP domain-containing protein n=1 Tax=Cryptolaemus montrouzieri TaxID=559131 RepID=A0ABD2P613_9CUCU
MSFHNILRKFVTPFTFNYSRTRHLCNALTTGKDIKQPDILMNMFKQASSTKYVLDTVNQHERVMNAKHIMQALRSLFVLQKEGRSELSTNTLINSKDFNRLCRKLKSLAGVIDIHETLEALKIVTYVGVPKDSTIVQVLLQLIRQNVNELSLSNIIFLEFLLGNYTNVPLADALKIALPIVFEIQLPVKMHRESISSLREYLFYASRNKLSQKTLDLILSSMLNCKETSDAKTAKSIVWSLTDLPPSSGFEALLKKNIDTLLVNIDELSYEDLETVLSKLSSAYRREYPFFKNKVFCDAVVGHIIDQDVGYAAAIRILRKLDRLDVINRYLIDYITKKIEEDTSLCEANNLFSIYVLTKYLSKTDYRPANWNYIEELIENLTTPKRSTLNWLKFAAALCYLRIFNEEILIKSFEENVEAKVNKRHSHIYLFMVIYHSLKLYKPQLLRVIPRNLRAKDLIQYLTIPEEFPLKSALYNAFGGEKYVKSGLFSKEGIFIDHVIIFRKGGYPVSTNFKSTFIEELDVAPDNQIALILCFPPELYTEEGHLKMGPSLCIKVLEDLGYVTVPVCWSNWNELADYEKIPYLVQNIKNKLGNEMMLENSVA